MTLSQIVDRSWYSVLVDTQLVFLSYGWVFTGIVSLSAATEILCAGGECGAQGVLQLGILPVTSRSLEQILP